MGAKVVEFSPKKLSQEQKDRLILSYMPNVKIIAKKVYKKLPSSYELDDLISCGTLGLMDAIEKYDPKQEVKFKTYAEYRIRGQILDELRSLDWASRATRDKIKNVEKVEKNLKSKLGRDATNKEMCKALKMKGQEFFKLQQRVQPVRIVSLSLGLVDNSYIPAALTDQNEYIDPVYNAQRSNVRKLIEEKIAGLPENEGKVLSLYYFEDRTMREISKELKVTESRVSQLHNSSISRLKKRVVDTELEAS